MLPSRLPRATRDGYSNNDSDFEESKMYDPSLRGTN